MQGISFKYVSMVDVQNRVSNFKKKKIKYAKDTPINFLFIYLLRINFKFHKNIISTNKPNENKYIKKLIRLWHKIDKILKKNKNGVQVLLKFVNLDVYSGWFVNQKLVNLWKTCYYRWN